MKKVLYYTITNKNNINNINMDNIYCHKQSLIDINTRIAALERVIATYNRKYGALPIMDTMLREHFIMRDSILMNYDLALKEENKSLTDVEADEVSKGLLRNLSIGEEFYPQYGLEFDALANDNKLK